MTEDNTSKSGAGAESTPAEQAAAAPRRGAGAMVLGVLALVVAIAAASVTGYLWYQVQIEQRLAQSQQLTDVKNTVNTAQVEVTALEKELGAVREQQRDVVNRIDTQIQARLDSLQSEQETLANRSEALSGSIEKVYEDLDRSLDSWALEEVEQLLRIANHSLQLSGDISTAVAGLELADKRLQELANPAFLEARERLAEDITALKSLEPVDIPGLALRLSGMAAQVEDLPIDQTAQRPVGETAEGSEQEAGPAEEWLESGGELLNDLSKLVRIQNIDEPAKPLMAPEQRYFLYSNLRLMLSGAQIAVLRKDTGTFRDNLDQASQWLREYFDPEHQGVQQILGDMDSMSGVELSPDLPDVSDSLTALQDAKNRMTQ